MLIGINGAKGSGKGAIADILVKNYGFKSVGFADKMKESICAIFGIDVETWDKWKNDDSMEVLIQRNLNSEIGMAKLNGQVPPIDIPHIRLTAREFIQRYGTEAHRDIFGLNFWIDSLMNEILADPGNWVIHDARMENELERIHKEGGFNVEVRRPEFGLDNSHSTEVRPRKELIDYTINNDGTLEDLEREVELLTLFLK